MFSDQVTFHVSDAVNRHNVQIWGTQQPHSIMEHVRDSPKVNVWHGVMYNMIIGPFFFAEKTVTGSSYLDMPFLSWNTCSQISFFNKTELHPTGR
jgi:hypothetical protein